MASNDIEQGKVFALERWKNLLLFNRSKAADKALIAVRRMADAKLFHPSEIDRYYNQMMNGVAVPEDFENGHTSHFTVA